TSPSRIRSRAGRFAIAAAIVGRFCGRRLREYSRTSFPCLYPSSRMPSYFRSKIHSGPVNRSCVSVAAIGSSHSGKESGIVDRTIDRMRIACLRLGDSQKGSRCQMNEHDDDLESTVHEEATKETDTYPDTADELDAQVTDSADDDEGPDLDEDEAEL